MLAWRGLLFSFLVVAQVSANAAPVAEPEEMVPMTAPFSSEEDISFTAKDLNKLIGFMLTDQFVGVIVRPFAKGDLRQLDLYDLGSRERLSETKSDEKTCLKLESAVYGPGDENADKKKLALAKSKTPSSAKALAKASVASATQVEIHQWRGTTACQLVRADPLEKEPLRETRLFILPLRKKIYGFEFRFAKTAKSADVTDILTFLKGLK